MRTLFTRLMGAGSQREREKVLHSGGGNKEPRWERAVETFSNEVSMILAHGETERVALCSVEGTEMNVGGQRSGL